MITFSEQNKYYVILFMLISMIKIIASFMYMGMFANIHYDWFGKLNQVKYKSDE